MNIGLTQRVDDLPGRSERRDGLDQAWAALLWEAGFIPVPLPNQPGCAAELLESLRIGGVILTGGNDLAGLPGAAGTAPERDEFERRLLELCGEKQLPVLGVCRGFQMLVSFHGGGLARVEDHVRRPHPVLPRPSGMPGLSRAEVNSFHSFGTRPDLLPPVLQPAGVAPDGSVEAIVHTRLPQWGILWHPERPIRPGAGRDSRDLVLMKSLFGGHAA
jgi:putative glutamine amidotransferase